MPKQRIFDFAHTLFLKGLEKINNTIKRRNNDIGHNDISLITT